MTIFVDDPMSACVPGRHRALIIQPGGLGDTLLTLPLGHFIMAMKEVSGVDLLAHEQYGGILRGRSVFEQVLDLDRLELHRLFTDPGSFHLPDRDPLIDIFGRYGLIVTFLADADGRFEANLIYTANMGQPCEVITIPLRYKEDYVGHIIDYYLESFTTQFPAEVPLWPDDLIKNICLKTKPTDRYSGEQIIADVGLNPERCIVIHPGSGGMAKCWPINHFEKLMYIFSEEGWDVVMVIGPAEQERLADEIERLKSQVPVIKDLQTHDLLALLSCAAGFVGNDSGPSHLAGVLGVPGVAIFGPTNPDNWRPMDSNMHICGRSNPGNGSKSNTAIWPDVEKVAQLLRQTMAGEKNPEKRS